MHHHRSRVRGRVPRAKLPPSTVIYLPYLGRPVFYFRFITSSLGSVISSMA